MSNKRQKEFFRNKFANLKRKKLNEIDLDEANASSTVIPDGSGIESSQGDASTAGGGTVLGPTLTKQHVPYTHHNSINHTFSECGHFYMPWTVTNIGGWYLFPWEKFYPFIGNYKMKLLTEEYKYWHCNAVELEFMNIKQSGQQADQTFMGPTQNARLLSYIDLDYLLSPIIDYTQENGLPETQIYATFLQDVIGSHTSGIHPVSNYLCKLPFFNMMNTNWHRFSLPTEKDHRVKITAANSNQVLKYNWVPHDNTWRSTDELAINSLRTQIKYQTLANLSRADNYMCRKSFGGMTRQSGYLDMNKQNSTTGTSYVPYSSYMTTFKNVDTEHYKYGAQPGWVQAFDVETSPIEYFDYIWSVPIFEKNPIPCILLSAQSQLGQNNNIIAQTFSIEFKITYHFSFFHTKVERQNLIVSGLNQRLYTDIRWDSGTEKQHIAYPFYVMSRNTNMQPFTFQAWDISDHVAQITTDGEPSDIKKDCEDLEKNKDIDLNHPKIINPRPRIREPLSTQKSILKEKTVAFKDTIHTEKSS